MEPVERLVLKHADVPYDPIKRRQYYLKTRELKGRRPKKALPIGTSRGAAKVLPKMTTFQRTMARAGPTKLANNRKQVEQRRASIEKQVEVLNAKLKRLREVLRGLKSAADKQKQQTPAEKKAAADKAAKARKDLTPAQKKEAAKKAKERRDKVAKTNSSPDQRLQEVVKKIANVQKEIQAARDKLQKGQRQKAEGNSQNGT